MLKVRPWCGQPSDQGRLKNRTEHEQPEGRIGDAGSTIETIMLYYRASYVAKNCEIATVDCTIINY